MRGLKVLIGLAISVLLGMVSCAEGETQEGTPPKPRPDGSLQNDSASPDAGGGASGADSGLEDSSIGPDPDAGDDAQPDAAGGDGGCQPE